MSEKIKNKSSNPFKKIGILLLFLLAGWVIIILALSLILHINPGSFFQEARDSLALNIIYLVLLYGLILMITNFKQKQDGKAGLIDLGLQLDKDKVNRTIKSVFCAGGIFLIYILILVFMGVYSLKPIPPSLLFIEIFKAILLGFLFAFVEEIFFRGYIFQTLLEEKSAVFSIVSTNLFFAVLHIFRPGSLTFKLIYFIGIFTVGAALSYLFIVSKNLWVSIGVHGTWVAFMYVIPNLLVVQRDLYMKSELLLGYEETPIAGIIGILLIFITVIFIKKIVFCNKEKSITT